MVEFFERKKVEKKKITVGHWLLIVLGVVMGFMVMMVLACWIWFSVTFVPYKKNEPDLRISYPKTWMVQDIVATGVLVGFVSPQQNALDAVTESVNFSTYDMTKEEFSNDAYADLLIEQILAVFPDFTFQEKVWFPVGGQSGHRMALTSVDPERVFIIYAFTIKEMGYNLVYMGEMADYQKQKTLLDAMAFMLRVKY